MKELKKKPDIEFGLVIMSNDVHYREIFDLDIEIHFVIRKTKKDISVFSRFYRLCREFKPDIVHCWDSMTAVYLVPVAKMLRIKLVNGMVADSPAQQNIRNKAWLRARLTFPFSNMVIGNSKAGLKAYHAPEKKSVCIYNGFNFGRVNGVSDKNFVLDQLGIKSTYVVGMVASFSSFKDYPTYYKAAEKLLEKRKDITFLAIGDNTDSEMSGKLILPQNEKYFRLLGRRTDIESLISIMHVCVLATFTEGISNSILEYMAMEKPVVATEGGGTSEVVNEGETGYLVKQGDAEELAGKIDLLLNDEEMRNRMGKAGKQWVKNNFSLDNMVEKFISTYSTLISA